MKKVKYCPFCENKTQMKQIQTQEFINLLIPERSGPLGKLVSPVAVKSDVKAYKCPECGYLALFEE